MYGGMPFVGHQAPFNRMKAKLAELNEKFKEQQDKEHALNESEWKKLTVW